MTSALADSGTMLAIEIRHSGGPDVLMPASRPIPQPDNGCILIRVHAAGVNRPDILQRRGLYPPPPGASEIPGLEIAGEVIALGAETVRYKLGDKVCALVAGGGYAQFCVVHESNALPVPHGLSMVEAAAVPEAFFTVWTNLFQRARLQAGETVLIHGGASGIGTTATMLARAFGATVIVTVGSEEKQNACLALGADFAINYHTQDFVEQTRKFTDGKGADVIVDIVAGDYVERNYKAAALNGRIVQIGVQNGPAKNLNLMIMMQKRLTHTGSTLRSRTIEEKAQIARELEHYVWPLLERKKLAPAIFQVFRLEEAANAHALLESDGHVGKIVLAAYP